MATAEKYTPPPESEQEKNKIEKIKLTEKNLIEFFMAYFKNSRNNIEENSEYDHFLRHKSITTTHNLLSFERGNIKQFFVIRNDEETIATTYLKIEDEKVASLWNVSVHVKHRGQGLASEIKEEAETKAKEAGCKLIYLEIEANNPIGITSELTDSYVITGYHPVSKRFTAEKRLDGEEIADKKTGKKSRILEEIPLNNKDAISAKIKAGWYGIDIKNIGEKDDNKPENWVLILEKQTKRKIIR